jgi:IS30 family transposase
VVAHLRAHERARRPKAGKIESTPWLQVLIQKRLAQRWRPEQIHLHLRRHHGNNPARQVCVETIYQSLYRPSEGGLSRSLTTRLRTGRSLRQRQRRPDRRTRRFVEAMRSIHDRPIHVLDRLEAGHWEGDLIIGTQNRSAIATLVERSTRYTKLIHLPDDHTAILAAHVRNRGSATCHAGVPRAMAAIGCSAQPLDGTRRREHTGGRGRASGRSATFVR